MNDTIFISYDMISFTMKAHYMYIDQKIKKLLTSDQWQIHLCCFFVTSWLFLKYTNLSIILLYEQIILPIVEIKSLAAVIEIIR